MWVLSDSFEMIEISDIRRQAKSFTNVSSPNHPIKTTNKQFDKSNSIDISVFILVWDRRRIFDVKH